MNRYPEPPPPLTPQNLSPSSSLIFPGRTAGSPAYGQSSWLYAAADCHLVYLPASGLFFAVILQLATEALWLTVILEILSPRCTIRIQGCQFALSILVPCLLYLLIYRPAPAKIIPSQRVNPLVFLSLTFIGLGLSLFSNLPSQAFVERFSDLFSCKIASDQMAASAMPPLAIGLFLISVTLFSLHSLRNLFSVGSNWDNSDDLAKGLLFLPALCCLVCFTATCLKSPLLF